MSNDAVVHDGALTVDVYSGPSPHEISVFGPICLMGNEVDAVLVKKALRDKINHTEAQDFLEKTRLWFLLFENNKSPSVDEEQRAGKELLDVTNVYVKALHTANMLEEWECMLFRQNELL